MNPTLRRDVSLLENSLARYKELLEYHIVTRLTDLRDYSTVNISGDKVVITWYEGIEDPILHQEFFDIEALQEPDKALCNTYKELINTLGACYEFDRKVQ